jgi:hypothetical protein
MGETTMTREVVLEQVGQRLGTLSEDVRRGVEAALDVIAFERLSQRAVQEQPSSAFVDANPTWDAMTRLGLEERSRAMQELERRNQAWLEAKCQELGALWLLVVDGQVLRWGRSLGSYVTDEEREEIGERTGKFPLYYEAEWSLLIEEEGWPASPFVTVNPHRVALVGRLPCLDLQPAVLLDSAQRQTTVQS